MKPLPGYYPRFATLDQRDFWDEATRSVILARVDDVPPIRFFQGSELATAEAVFARILPQDDREEDRRIPIVPIVDARLYARRGAGYRFDGTPDDPEAMRFALRAIDGMAREIYARPFHELPMPDQEILLQGLRDGTPAGSEEHWRAVPSAHAWTLLVQDAVEAYYAHPWAWDEIGFGGPAYPRGYMRLENGAREPWEVDEVRTEWTAPDGSASDDYRPLRDLLGIARKRSPG